MLGESSEMGLSLNLTPSDTRWTTCAHTSCPLALARAVFCSQSSMLYRKLVTGKCSGSSPSAGRNDSSTSSFSLP